MSSRSRSLVWARCATQSPTDRLGRARRLRSPALAGTIDGTGHTAVTSRIREGRAAVVQTQSSGASQTATKPAVIDCDIHDVVPSARRRSSRTCPSTGASTSPSRRSRGRSTRRIRRTRRPRRGRTRRRRRGPPGSEPRPAAGSRCSTPWNVEIGILNCAYAVDSVHNPDAAAALAQRRQRLADRRVARAGAAPARLDRRAEPACRRWRRAEIDRVGGHPGFVQVFLPVRSERAVRQPPLPPDLRGGRAPRSGRRPPVRRRARQPADRRRLAVVLRRGVRRHGPGLPVPADRA